MKLIVNSSESLSKAIGEIRAAWNDKKYLKINFTSGKNRSISQNDLTHVWYEQLARELREDDAIGWKAYSKLHHGVPILRAEDEEYRAAYDASIKDVFSYEQKLAVMRYWPVTSLMTKPQLSKYLEAMQADFAQRGVVLEFPEGEQ